MQANRQTDRQRDTIEQIPKTKHRYVTPMTEKRMNSSYTTKQYCVYIIPSCGNGKPEF